MRNIINREWLCQMLDKAAARDRIGDQVAQQLVAFYLYNRFLASWDPGWLQELFKILIGLFQRIGLFTTNASKAKNHGIGLYLGTYTRGLHREALHQIQISEWSSRQQQALSGRLWYLRWQRSLAAGSCQSHLESQHNIFWFMWTIVHLWSNVLLNQSSWAHTSAQYRTASGSDQA